MNYARVLLAGVLLLLCGYNVFHFFDSEPASYTMFRKTPENIYKDYMLNYAIETIRTDTALKDASNVCLTVSPENEDYFSRLHIQEQFMYFLPGQSINIEIDSQVQNNQIFISRRCGQYVTESFWQALDYCNQYQKFVCPPDLGIATK
jgi:hypothetical protein